MTAVNVTAQRRKDRSLASVVNHAIIMDFTIRQPGFNIHCHVWAPASERTGKLDPLWRSRLISHPLKTHLIQTPVWPIVTYGAEAWTWTKDLRCNTLRLSKCNVTGEVWRSHAEIMSRMKRCWNNVIRKGNCSQWWKVAKWYTSVTFHATPHQASGDREANAKHCQMTSWNGPARQYRTWSGKQRIDRRIKDSFMRSPTLAHRVRHLDWWALLIHFWTALAKSVVCDCGQRQITEHCET